MIELQVQSVRISLLSSRRVVVLKEVDAERFLPIWIGAAEADAIVVKLQDMEISRPLTHDLLNNVIHALDAEVTHVVISQLVDNAEGSATFHARVVLSADDAEIEVDSRSSDAIALAVRAGVPIYADEGVMERAAVSPSANLEEQGAAVSDEELSIFRDFIDGIEE
jgi:bifunctional DNase/RNase